MSLRDRLGRLAGRHTEVDEGYVYPLDRTQERVYAADFEGDVYVWDIDKTYLASEFDSLKGLLSIPLELAVDKRNVAGTDVLLRALRRGRTDDEERIRSNPLYFVSASPPQLRAVIQRKMVLDGVEFDGITFKDQLALLRRRKVSKMTEQVGYKLSALLNNRLELPWGVRETLFGDDSEADVLIYAIYADLVAGRLRGEALERTLLKAGVDEQDAAYIARISSDLTERELVDRIYINLEKRTPPSRFADFGPRVVPCYDSFQMALHLYAARKIDRSAVLDVGRELLGHYGRQPLGLMRSGFDLIERGRLGLPVLADLWPDLHRRHLVPDYAALVADAEAPPLLEDGGIDFITPASYLALSDAT